MVQSFIYLSFKWSWFITRNAFWLGLWLFGLVIFATYLMRWWPGDRLFPVRMMKYVMPWLLVGLIPSLLMARLGHRDGLTVLLALPIIFISFTYAPLFLPRSEVALADDSFKVMSYNIRRGNTDMIAVSKVIREQKPDILLLQELHPSQAHSFMDALGNLYPDVEMQLSYEPETLQAIISRYPLTPIGSDYHQIRAQKVSLDTPSGKITVWNIHPSSKESWLSRHHLISDLLETEINLTEGPIIFGGDFNTTDQIRTHRLITNYLQDAHWQAGRGFGFTYPANTPRLRGQIPIPPLVRIDYIFYNDHFFAHKTSTLKNSGNSDHFPIIAKLSWLSGTQNRSAGVP